MQLADAAKETLQEEEPSPTALVAVGPTPLVGATPDALVVDTGQLVQKPGPLPVVDRAPAPGHARVVLANVVGVARPVPTGAVPLAVAHAPLRRAAALQEAAVATMEAAAPP